MKYKEFFYHVTGFHAFPYQQKLGEGDWPGLLDVPTGLGKTAAVVCAWLYRIGEGDPGTPNRLVYCLPMRVLVEQTQRSIETWIHAAEEFFQAKGRALPKVHVLMGGEQDSHWDEQPESPAVLVGTQDMLLSRALMRGYGLSRYRWPMHFAVLHSDALWVYDEVQLMGAGIATSAQLEAFRRRYGVPRPSKSLWISATLNRDWLATVDFGVYLASLDTLSLDREEQALGVVQARREAVKHLQPAGIVLDSHTAKSKAKEYIHALGESVLQRHRAGANTLVILNTVERAQSLFLALKKAKPDARLMLIHSRFRPAERQDLNQRLATVPPPEGQIIVATQAVEAGVDMSSAVLFTELAPWPSLVQRFGRCNRYGEYNDGGAWLFWMDIEDGQGAPYEPEQLASARAKLDGLEDASPATLPPTDEQAGLYETLRARDFIDLFNTDPDLSGFDLDVSRFIRDTTDTDVQVFWRDLSSGLQEQPSPAAEELCRGSLVQVKPLVDRIRKAGKMVYSWDPLGSDTHWRPFNGNLRPGLTLLVDHSGGGYDPELGFFPLHKATVPVIAHVLAPMEPETDEADTLSQLPKPIELGRHLANAEDHALALCYALGDQDAARTVPRAARWHDVGKAHRAFQTMLLYQDEQAVSKEQRLWAKGAGSGRSIYAVCGGPGGYTQRRHFRHELASMLAWLAQHGDHPDADLVAYLIVAHHGKIRMGLRSLPGETTPPDGRLFARGVWAGDVLPEVTVPDRETSLPVHLDLDLMQIGEGPQGPSWVARSARLLDQYGPFRLAWLETLVRIADWRASRGEQEGE